MSGKIMGQVWELDLPHNQMIVLLAMADHADHEGQNVYPSIGLIAWKTGYHERHVRRLIGKLTKSGLLKKEAARAGKTTVYSIHTEVGAKKAPYVTPDKMSPLTSDDTPTPDKMSGDIGQNVTPDTKKEDVTPDKMSGDPGHSYSIPTPDIAVSPEPSLKPSKNHKRDKEISLSSLGAPQSKNPLPPTDTPTDDKSDDDFSLLMPYQESFGKITAASQTLRGLLQTQITRLGETTTRTVLERCQRKGGKSWGYVHKALQNEPTPTKPIAIPEPEPLPDIPSDIPTSASKPPPITAPIQATERIHHEWRVSWQAEPKGTVERAWTEAVVLMQDQLPGEVASAAKKLTLVDFEPETHTFIVVAGTDLAHSLSQHVGRRNIEGVLSDRYGQPAQLHVYMKAEWPPIQQAA